MARNLAFLLTALFLAGCAGSASNHSSLSTRPAPIVGATASGFPHISLPTAKAVSTTYGKWEVVDSYNADFTGDMLVLKPVASDAWPFAWAIIDLGPQNPKLHIESLFFTTQADWSAPNPPAYAWIGLSDYTHGKWMWRKRDASFTTTTPTFFGDAPAGTKFFQSADPHHAYMAVVSDYNPVDFGESVGVRAVPEIHRYQPDLGYSAGQDNKFLFNSTNGTGDIVTFCPDPAQNGGVVARLDIQPDYSINWDFIPLFESGKPLAGCFRYDIDHTSTGKLAILAAGQSPASIIRYITESTPAGTFNLPETVADASDFLPPTYDDPQLALALDSSDNAHIVYADNSNSLRYVFKIVTAWFTSGPGYTQCTHDLDIAVNNSDMIVCFRNNETTQTALGIGSYPASNASDPWDPKYQVYFDPSKNSGNFNSMRIGPGNRVYIAQYVAKPSGPGSGGLSGLVANYNESGVLASAWTSESVDPGKDVASGDKYVAGPHCSLGLLRDGTPVIAYQCQDSITSKYSLHMAVGSTVNGGPGWYEFIVDDDPAPNTLGVNTAVDVKPGTGSNPDLIGVAYGSTTGAQSKLRFAVIVW